MRQSGSFFHPMRENWRDARIESGAVYTWRHVNLLTELWTIFDFSVRVWSFHQWQAHCWRSERKRTSSQRVSGSYQSGAWCLSYGRRNTGDVSLLFKMSYCILIVCVQCSSCFTQLEKKYLPCSLAFNNPHMCCGEFSCNKLKLSKLKEWFEMEIV